MKSFLWVTAHVFEADCMEAASAALQAGLAHKRNFQVIFCATLRNRRIAPSGFAAVPHGLVRGIGVTCQTLLWQLRISARGRDFTVCLRLGRQT
jgi:hypothetical protein